MIVVNIIAEYKRITVRSGDEHFCVFCTAESLEERHEDVLNWAYRLAERLHWRNYDVAITQASELQATDRMPALFEHRYPAS